MHGGRRGRRAAQPTGRQHLQPRCRAARGGDGYALTPAGRVLLVAVATYGVYKAVPLVQKVWNETAAPGLKNINDRVQPKLDAGEEADTNDGT